MTFKPVDRVPHEEFGYWPQTLERWHAEGLPAEVDSDWKADRYFNFDPRATAPVSLLMHPGFEQKVLDDRGRVRIIQDGNGATCEVFTDGTATIPRFLEYGLKGQEDWARYREKLDPEMPGRYPDDWDKAAEGYKTRDYPLGLHLGGGFYGSLRDWMGVEGLSEAFYEQPAFIHEVLDSVCECMIKSAQRALSSVEFDFASYWEDMAYNKGPLMSPVMFGEFMVPRYKRVSDALGRHGIKLTIVDCDGQMEPLVEMWLDAGVNIMFPLEVRAGVDPARLRKQYGRRVLLMGGVNKIEVAKGKRAIDEELKRIAPLVADGGFIPHVDHRVHPGVSFWDYLYYLEQKKKLLGF